MSRLVQILSPFQAIVIVANCPSTHQKGFSDQLDHRSLNGSCLIFFSMIL